MVFKIFRIYYNFLIVLLIRLKNCRSNVFSFIARQNVRDFPGLSQMLRARVSQLASGTQFKQTWISLLTGSRISSWKLTMINVISSQILLKILHYIKNETVANSSNQTLFDILFDNKFNFDEHVVWLCRKASHRFKSGM